MTTRNQTGIVIELACHTTDRTVVEQRALLAFALRLDCANGSWAGSNTPHRQPPYYVQLVLDTLDPNLPAVALTASQQAKYDRMAARWTTCTACGRPVGAHPDEQPCTTDISARYPTRDGGENGSSTGADLDAVRVVVTA